MTEDILITAQRTLGDVTANIYKRQLEEFAAAIAAAEREACAQACERGTFIITGQHYANLIRARSKA